MTSLESARASSAKSSEYEAEPTVYLPWYSVVLVAALLSIVGVTSARMQLGLESRLVFAAVRCVIQLSMLGFVLMPIFRLNISVLTVMYMMTMALLASRESYGRMPYVYDGLFSHVVIATVAGAGLVSSFGLCLVLRTFADAQYAIPTLGMLLGNSLSGTSVCLSCLLTELAEHKGNVETLIGFGATRWEATRDVLKRSTVMGLTPSLNQMAISGVVAIPGMMTGQILGGTPPLQAARYQIVLTYLINSCTCLTLVIATRLVLQSLLGANHAILDYKLVRPERPQDGSIWRKVLYFFWPFTSSQKSAQVQNTVKSSANKDTSSARSGNEREPLLKA